MKVVIVESPAKAKTINKYLGKDYDVYASFGHVRDLAAKDGSVDPDNDFAMRWEVDAKAAKRLNDIAAAVKGADRVILATDPDREGEAISWHVYEILKAKKVLKDKRVDRVVFNAVTKEAVHDGDAPSARDRRGAGRRLSRPPRARLSRRLQPFAGAVAQAAGRALGGPRAVGGAAHRLRPRARDREIRRARILVDRRPSEDRRPSAPFTARLVGADGKKISRLDVGSGEEAEAFKAALEAAKFSVVSVEAKPVKRHPYPPFTTSTLQQEASRKLGLAPARTMQIAQRLYEGVDIGEGAVGLITYMRTDGVDLAPEAVDGARATSSPRISATTTSPPRRANTRSRPRTRRKRTRRSARPTHAPAARRRAPSRARPGQALRADLDPHHRLPDGERRTRAHHRRHPRRGGRARKLEFRATGQVVRFAGFLALYQEGRDDEEDEDAARLPPMKAGEPLTKERIEATQHFTEPPPRYTEATLVKRMEELGIGRPSTYASTLAVLRDRDYVRHREEAADPRGQGPARHRLPRILLRQIRRLRLHRRARGEARQGLQQRDRLEGRCCATSGVDFSGALGGTKDLRTTQVLDSLNELLGPHIFPARADGADPRLCPLCGKGQLSLKLGKFGAFIGCSNYPECRFTRVLSPTGQDGPAARASGRACACSGVDPATGDEITLRSGRFGDYVQLGEGEKPKRCSLPQGPGARRRDARKGARAAVAAARGGAPSDQRRADPRRHRPLRLLCPARQDLRQSRPRRRRAGDRRQPRHRPHRRQGKRRRRRRFGAGSGRALGEHPTLGGAVAVKQGRFGAYVNHGKINATLPKGTDTDALTLDEAVAALAAKAAGGGVGGGRMLGEHPEGGPITVRAGRFGAYVNWGKVNATIPKSISPEEITLGEAIELIAEREGRPAGGAARKPAKAKAKAKTPAAKAKAPAATKRPAAAKPVAKAKAKPAAKEKAAPGKAKPAPTAKRKA